LTDPDTDTAVDVDLAFVKALSHPVRAEALRLLNQRVMSPNDLARELSVPLGTISYHVRELAKYGCIELVELVPRRGATEHRYRALERAIFSDEDWAEVPDSVKASIVGMHFRATGKMISDSVAAGVFERRANRHHSIFETGVDEQGWNEAMALLNDTMLRMQEIEAGSRERLAQDDDAEVIPLAVSLLGFETAPRRRGNEKAG
jgi:DNA-binding transcriptional ArsR family regulator